MQYKQKYRPNEKLDLGADPVRIHGFTTDGTLKHKVHLYPDCDTVFNASRHKDDFPSLVDIGEVDVPGNQICEACAREKIRRTKVGGKLRGRKRSV